MPVLLLSLFRLSGQQPAANPYLTVPLQNMQPFRSPDANWKIAGSAQADLYKDEVLTTGAGTGVLANVPDKKSRGNLVFMLEHGDVDLDLEFMMARHSNSGIYLQGRYEVQLYDSWGVKTPSFHDCGGIYERWDDSKPAGKQGFEGYAPRANAAHAPGLWQKLHIVFLAPRFDSSGHKTANARILRIELNGILLHENLEITGPTRGPAFPGESARGPLLIQGDHGPVAFRNIRYRLYDQQPARLTNLQYRVFQGDFNEMPDLNKLTPVATGKTDVLTQEVGRMNEKMLIQFTGTLKAPAAGLYRFNLNALGNGSLKINGQEVIKYGEWERDGQISLPAGDLPIEIIYNKRVNWFHNGLALFAEGPGFRETALHALSSLAPSDPDRPISVTVGSEPEVLRSFSDYAPTDTGKTHRIVRAINVGFPEKTSFTYNAANGAMFQAWKGGFLDATPMWNSRGDGSTRPAGDLLRLADAPVVVMPGQADAVIPDTVPAQANFRILGYEFDDARVPTFHYRIWGSDCSDRISTGEEGRSLNRTLLLEHGETNGLFLRLASGSHIEVSGPGQYAIDGYYFIRVPAEEKPQVRTAGNRQELLIPVAAGKTATWTLIW